MKRLDVYLSSSAASDFANPAADDRGRLVGTLAEVERRIYFEYDARFLKDPLWLSPFKLPPEPGLHEHRDLAFGPMFGLFDDSLPDGWGLLLMDRYFRRKGMALAARSPLDRLAYLGTRTMGALTYYPPAEANAVDESAFDLHDLACAAYRVLEGKVADVLPQLLRAGGSPGGARPKVLVGMRGESMVSGEDALPSGYTAWMVKFHSRQDAADDGRIACAARALRRALHCLHAADDLGYGDHLCPHVTAAAWSGWPCCGGGDGRGAWRRGDRRLGRGCVARAPQSAPRLLRA